MQYLLTKHKYQYESRENLHVDAYAFLGCTYIYTHIFLLTKIFYEHTYIFTRYFATYINMLVALYD